MGVIKNNQSTERWYILGDLKNTTVAAPKAVTSQAPSVAANAIMTKLSIMHPLYTIILAIMILVHIMCLIKKGKHYPEKAFPFLNYAQYF